MACAVDGTSPVRFTGQISSTQTITSASFTAPANSFLVVCTEWDGLDSFGVVHTVTDSGGLSWTQQVLRSWTETTVHGASSIWTAVQASSAARTVRVNNTGGSGSPRASAKVYVVTGADITGTPVDTVTASNEGGSSTNNLTTTSLTPGANGLLFAADCEWNQLGSFEASSNLTQNTADYAGEISVCDGYRTVTSGVGATANLNAGGAGGAQHKWCQIIVREAAAAATTRRLAALGVG